MKKFFYVVAIFILYNNCVVAQSEEKKGYIGLSLGSAIPLGDYGDASINNENAGFAKTGFLFDVSFSYLIAKPLAITAIIRGRGNGIKTDDLVTEFEKAFPGTNFTITADPWSDGSFLAGLSFPFSIGTTGKTFCEPRALIGYMNATTGATKVTGSDTNGVTWLQQDKQNGNSFTYLFGLGFRFNVSNSIGILLNADYQGAKPEFNDVKFSESNGSSWKTSFKQNMSTVDVAVGIAFLLQ